MPFLALLHHVLTLLYHGLDHLYFSTYSQHFLLKNCAECSCKDKSYFHSKKGLITPPLSDAGPWKASVGGDYIGVKKKLEKEIQKSEIKSKIKN